MTIQTSGSKVRRARINAFVDAVGTAICVAGTVWYCVWLMPIQDIWATLQGATAVIYSYASALKLRSSVRQIRLAELTEQTDAVNAELDDIKARRSALLAE